MLRFSTSEDGRLHAEKYYQTVGEEYATTSKTFRWRQIIGLARVTASAYGYNRQDQHGFRAPRVRAGLQAPRRRSLGLPVSVKTIHEPGVAELVTIRRG